MENNGTNVPVTCPGTEGVLAMARVPIQPWTAVYDGSTALSRGTLFPALDLPYIGKEDAR